MRRLSRRKALSLVKELDAFPKVPDSYMETSASGGTVSLLAFGVMAVLAVLEFFVYRDTWMKYDYEVDKDFSSKMRINIDITVAMKCQHVGADILDLAETMIMSNGLKYEPVIFELSPQQRLWHRTLLVIQKGLGEQHSLQDVLYKTVHKGAPTTLPLREGASLEPLSACRIHGHIYVNKVAGNFHITVPGVIHPLDGTQKTTPNNNQMFQYFITVVPTKLHTYKISADTHQFAVTEREREIDHAAGSHGVAGIFVKYDTSALMVTVREQHMPLGQFLVRLCGIVGGVFSTTGMLHRFVGTCVDVVCCRFKLGVYKPTEVRVSTDLTLRRVRTQPPEESPD
uniref:Endoplasmic reticulum-Golgi intermediate compartment protein n=1 Tax=Gadus morhua TaxID=8049 RepID=A0A8C5FJ29_GADMO